MTASHFFFFPFPRANCSSVVDGSLTDWAKELSAGDTKAVEAFTLDSLIVVFERSATNYTAVQKDKPDIYRSRLISFGERGYADDVLYVVGHCDAGGKVLASPDEKKECTVAELVGHLQILPPDWPGRIKIYGCESASTFWFGASQSFAKRFRDVFVKTHPGPSIWGYTHSIASWYTTDGTGTRHKFVDGERSSRYLQRIQ